LISFFISTTNERTDSGHYFSGVALRSTGILPVGRPGVSPGRLLLKQSRRSESVPWQGKMPAGPAAKMAARTTVIAVATVYDRRVSFSGTLVKTEDNEANKGSSKRIPILVSIFASMSQSVLSA
jgi:hypothetical protein